MMEDILSNLTEDNNIEARLNTMHATYLMVQCCRDSQSSIRGLSVFNALKSQYFEVNPEVNFNVDVLIVVVVTLIHICISGSTSVWHHSC